jgi:hypothetical protein
MAFWALVLPWLKYVVPPRALARLMWRSARITQRDPEGEMRIAALSHLVHRGRRRRRYNCLERSLIAYRFLSEANADPQLVLGIRRPSRRLEVHAWVVVDGAPVRESPAALRGIEPLIAFGPRGVLQRPPELPGHA